jgi:hypothetical protein
MSLFSRYLEADARGNERLRNALRLRPYTCISGVVASMAIVGGLVYTFVYADNYEDRIHHGWESALGIILLWAVFFLFYFLENNRPLPIAARRLAWLGILILYGSGIVLCAFASADSSIGSGLYLALRLGVILPVALLAWQFIRKKNE